MPLPSDAELRELLRRDLEPRRDVERPRRGAEPPQEVTPARRAARRIMRGLCWIGLAVSIVLLGTGVWLFFNAEPIIGGPMVAFTLIGAAFVGIPCLGYLKTGKLEIPPVPFD
jgi:hypothetical protein